MNFIVYRQKSFVFFFFKTTHVRTQTFRHRCETKSGSSGIRKVTVHSNLNCFYGRVREVVILSYRKISIRVRAVNLFFPESTSLQIGFGIYYLFFWSHAYSETSCSFVDVRVPAQRLNGRSENNPRRGNKYSSSRCGAVTFEIPVQFQLRNGVVAAAYVY